MTVAIYALCAVAPLLCTFLLLQLYERTGQPLLVWMGLAVGGLTLNNFLLVFDKVIFPEVDLLPWRALVDLFSMAILFYGLLRAHLDRIAE